jgi:hypothetical protein
MTMIEFYQVGSRPAFSKDPAKILEVDTDDPLIVGVRIFILFTLATFFVVIGLGRHPSFWNFNTQARASSLFSAAPLLFTLLDLFDDVRVEHERDPQLSCLIVGSRPRSAQVRV